MIISDVFEKNTFQKIRKEGREGKKSLAPKDFGGFNKKKLPLFDKSLTTL